MVIELPPEIEARLQQVASAGGLSPETFVSEVVLHALAFEEQDSEVLRERRRQADQGIFIEQDEMERRFQQMMQS